ncbi:MAG: tRNA pseudouridine(38-40) synthase TruA [Dissulfurispiraceae bacterium]
MRNIKLVIQYDGTNYSGWQVQPKAVTIQGILQEKIGKITGEKPTVLGAGRTDAGVHAIGQIGAFRTSSQLSPSVVQSALNATLPHDIRILNACEDDASFHPRYDAKSKRYFYVISFARTPSPFLYKYAWKVPYMLDIDAMNCASQILKGRHDFSAFRASGCGAKNTIKTVFQLSIERSETMEFMCTKINGAFLRIVIDADSFLRRMARNIVGTLIEIGKGRISAETIEGILSSKDRKCAGPCAPASGLFLEKVSY